MSPMNLEDVEKHLMKRAKHVRESFIKVDLEPFIKQCFVELRAIEASILKT